MNTAPTRISGAFIQARWMTAAGIQGVRYEGGSLLHLVKQVVARLVSPANIEP